MLTPGYHGGVRRTLLTALLVLLSVGPAVASETIRLRGGDKLEVDAVEVLEDRIRITLLRDGGTARMDLPFARLQGRGLLALIDRHTSPEDATWRLRSARLALERGLRAEAARRFRRAAKLDPALAEERDAGLARIAALEATDGLDALERALRRGDDPHAAMALAGALLDGPQAASLTPAQRLRAETLARLARALFKREQQRAARALIEAKKPAPPAPVEPPPVDEDLASRLRALETKADVAREAASQPKLSSTRALRHLRKAADLLRDARRVLRSAPPAARTALVETSERLRLTLAATYLELADLLRVLGRFNEARAHVRAALILDPGNERAWTQRELIERDARRDPAFESSGLGFESFTYSPSPFFGFRRYPRPYVRGYRPLGSHSVFGIRLRLGSSGTKRGTRRVVGTRR